ncbi:MAG: glycosyltransferase family 9 protein [bacterium]|nr:glycosyltransferase family 9 protein [bacterium]
MKILIVQTAFIGDVVLCTPMIKSLKGAGHEAGFVLKPEASNLLEKDASLSHLHIYDKRGRDRGVKGFSRVLSELKKCEYDAAVVPHRSIRSAMLVKAAGICKTVGFDKSAGSWLFTDKIVYKTDMHEVLRNHGLLGPLNITGEPPAPYIEHTPDDKGKVGEVLSRWGIKDGETLIAFGPGSKWYTKQWGESNYRDLSKILLREYDCRIICFGGKEEIALCDSIASINKEKIHNAAGLFSLRESVAALQKIKLSFSNDNGFMHLSVAADTPVVAIFGPTVPEFGFAPWGEKHTVAGIDIPCRPCRIHGSEKCPEKHFECMKELKPEIVLEAGSKYLDRQP